MRKKERQLVQEDCQRILEHSEYGILGTVGENGYPLTTPLNYTFLNDNIYFHCALEGQKLDNIAFNNLVSFTVVGKTKILSEKFSTCYESVIAFGKAELIDGEEKHLALEALIDKYSVDFKAEGLKYIESASKITGVIKITLEKITGKGLMD